MHYNFFILHFFGNYITYDPIVCTPCFCYTALLILASQPQPFLSLHSDHAFPSLKKSIFKDTGLHILCLYYSYISAKLLINPLMLKRMIYIFFFYTLKHIKSFGLYVNIYHKIIYFKQIMINFNILMKFE